MDLKIGEAETQFLEQVEQRLSLAITVEHGVTPHSGEVLAQAARHLCLTKNAKRARPMLTLFFGDAIGISRDRLVQAAAAGELIHAASLLHDDVIDDAKTRRGRPTVNVHWNNSIAVLAGNYLLSAAFSALKDYPQSLINDAVDLISLMTKAAIAELEIRGKLNVGIKEWRDIAIGKTGALFAWCGRAAAMIAGDEDAVMRFYRCGLHIGVAFQLADDIRDLQDKHSLKDRFSDIKNREPSYPILLAIESASIKSEIQKLWTQESISDADLHRIGNVVIESGAADRTSIAIKNEIEAAIDALGNKASNIGGQRISFWLAQLYQSAHCGFEMSAIHSI